MPSLQVREVPESLYARLAEESERERRSIAQQAVALLSRALDVDVDSRKRRARVLDRIAAAPVKLPKLKGGKTPVDLVREDRKR